MKHTVIVGIGNTILGDEGVGVHVLNKLRRKKLPKEVDLVEGGVGGLAVLEYIKGAERAIFIDAVGGGTAGKIHRLTEADLGDKVKTSLHPASAHDIGLPETVKIGRSIYPDQMPRKIIIYGIEIVEPRTYATRLSNTVNESADKVVDLIVKELRSESRL